MMSRSGTSFSPTLNRNAETECGSRRRVPCTIAEIHAPVADAAMLAAGGSRWSVVSYIGSTTGGENADSWLDLFLRRQYVSAHRADLAHRYIAAGARRRRQEALRPPELESAGGRGVL